MASSSSCSVSIPINRITKSHKCLPINFKTLAYPIASASSPSLFSFPSLRSSDRRVFFNLRASDPHSVEQPEEVKLNWQDDVQSIQKEADLKYLPNVDELINAYKEAVFSGDDKATSEIEAKLNTVENQRNMLVQKCLFIQDELSSGKERYIRLQADFDNLRKRSDKEKLTVANDAKGEVLKKLLAMVDGFERARQQIKTETDKEEKIDKSYQGIYKQFVEIMRSLNVAVIPTVGRPFNPSIHEAIAREKSEEFKAGIVIQEIRRGFLLGNRLLRPATVKISSGPAKKKFEQATGVVDAF